MSFSTAITNEQINMLPVTYFDGRILIVDSAESMAEAERVLEGQLLLGVDTETRPAFTKGLHYDMALLQVSTADVALLFRLQMQPLSQKVKEVLESKQVLKIGAALRDDLRGLQQSQGKMKLNGFVDLQTIVGQWGIDDKSVKKMAAIVMKLKVSKAQRLSNWEAKTLTPAQQQYAAIDAWICRQIYIKLGESPKVKVGQTKGRSEDSKAAKLNETTKIK